MKRVLDPNRPVGHESRKGYAARCASGFWDAYLNGPVVLDVGHRGGLQDALPIVDGAIGIEHGYPGYDGLRLPFADGSVDAVHASHVLEHVGSVDESGWGHSANNHLREWFRVLRIGGHLVLMVPHAYLYERRLTVPPSRWSPEHVRAYTPASLLVEVEGALEPNSYRVRSLRDRDAGYGYAVPSTTHPIGQFEVELVLQRIAQPAWKVEP